MLVTVADVSKAIKSLNNCAPGPYDRIVKLFKEWMTELANAIKKMCNYFVQHGSCPIMYFEAGDQGYQWIPKDYPAN